MLYVHTTIYYWVSSIKAKNKPLTYLGPGNLLPWHGVLLGPQTWARCGREIFTEALLLATDFFVHNFRIFRAKDLSAARNRRRKESFGAETIPQVSSYTGYWIVYGNTEAPPSNKSGMRFLQTLKKLLWRKADYLES